MSSRRVLTSLSIAKNVAELAADKKGEDIVLLDMKKLVNFCDYFVVSSATSDRHARAIADAIEEGLMPIGQTVKINKNLRDSTWIVLDVGSVITHIFVKDLREFYNLEYLWRDAKKVNWKK